jgi:hypothetical protein
MRRSTLLVRALQQTHDTIGRTESCILLAVWLQAPQLRDNAFLPERAPGRELVSSDHWIWLMPDGRVLAMADPLPAACFFDENAPHRFGRSSEEMGAVLPGGLRIATQSQPSLMHKGRWLQSRTRLFSGHFNPSNSSQFIVDTGVQLLRRLSVLWLHPFEDAGDITHNDEL